MTQATTENQDSAPATVLVTGGSGALGGAMVNAILQAFPAARVHATSFRAKPTVADERLHWHPLDLRDAEAIEAFAGGFERVDWIINCAGYLHGEMGGPEKSIRAIDADFLLENMRINTLPTLLLAKHFSSALKKSPAPLLATISARVGSIEDNRLGGWYSYRMSKAALNMALKTLSIEWKHSHPRGCVAALHPGTNDSPLSKPFQANVAAPNLFDPKDTAACFLRLLQRLNAGDSGKFWTWDGATLPW